MKDQWSLETLRLKDSNALRPASPDLEAFRSWMVALGGVAS